MPPGGPPARWVLRSGRDEDAPALLELWRVSEAEPTSTDDVASLRALVARDPDALVVAEADGEMVGCIVAGFDGWRANLYRLAVHPRLRRRGLASALVAEAERRVTRLGARRVNALVVVDHPHAVAFWEAAGYRRDHHLGRHVKTFVDPVRPPG